MRVCERECAHVHAADCLSSSRGQQTLMVGQCLLLFLVVSSLLGFRSPNLNHPVCANVFIPSSCSRQIDGNTGLYCLYRHGWHSESQTLQQEAATFHSHYYYYYYHKISDSKYPIGIANNIQTCTVGTSNHQSEQRPRFRFKCEIQLQVLN